MSNLQIKKHNYEQVKLEDLIHYERNARTHSEEQIDQVINSIKQFGFTNPLLIDEDNIIIAGHGRATAALKIGMEYVPAIRLKELNDVQKKALRIADNQIALNAGWDYDILASELDEIKLDEFDLDIMGFDDEFLDNLLFSNTSEENEEDIYNDEEEIEIESRANIGDVWLLGRHRLICGDSTKEETIKKLFSDVGNVDLLITDPPYNINYEGATEDKLTIKNDNMDSDNFISFLTSAFKSANKVMKKGAAFYIWHASATIPEFYKAIDNVKEWNHKQYLIWVKNAFTFGRQDYQWKHEPCIYGWKEGASHYFVDDRKQSTVLEYDKPTRNAEHPTMKPIPLFERLILNSTKHGDLVFDPFAGSGTSLIACERLERTCFVCELDPHYCDVIINRWEQMTGQTAEKINN